MQAVGEVASAFGEVVGTSVLSTKAQASTTLRMAFSRQHRVVRLIPCTMRLKDLEITVIHFLIGHRIAGKVVLERCDPVTRLQSTFSGPNSRILDTLKYPVRYVQPTTTASGS